MIGQSISHYKILERIGEGGMGVVYRAHDENLDRVVAIKLLAARSESSSEDALRFEQEAKAISSLSHPHIATIHDRGEVDGKPFLVLEYLPGGTLREKLRRRREEGGEFSLREILRYALEAAQALAHAHRRGVIHRDVKTDNMILTEEGSVKVTDFGLARWAGSARITGRGSMLGTAVYMSPEQAQGLEADARSDIFSFGSVLYELAAGKPPFEGLYPAAVAYDIINAPTPSLRAQRPDLPQELEGVTSKALEKKPENRYQSMEDLVADLSSLRDAMISDSGTQPAPVHARRRGRLHWVAAAAVLLAIALGGWLWIDRPAPADVPAPVAAARPISVAVLPLENLSADPGQDYLADGMTEALITNLAKMGGLRVISRTSVMQYKDSPRTIREIAQDLGVTHVVEGTVLRSGEEIRITAQLIDADRDEHLWAESYQRRLTDVLSLQRDVAQSIVGEVTTQINAGGHRRRVRAMRSMQPEAYEAYLRGRQLAFQWSPEAIDQGIAYYQRAVEIDPEYADAFAGLAAAFGLKALFGTVPASDAWPMAREAAERALQLDDTGEDAHVAMGFVQGGYDWNWYGAEMEFRRALELNPGSALAHHAYAMMCLAPQGRLDEALVEIEKARDLDPLSPSVNVNVADVHYFRREFDRANEQYLKTLELDPAFPKVRGWLANSYFTTGDLAEAAKWYQESFTTQRQENPLPRVAYLIASGQNDEARAMLEQLGRQPELARVLNGDFAVLYAMLGDTENAFQWLEQAYLERSGRIVFAKVSPVFDPLRSDERFQSLLRRMGLER